MCIINTAIQSSYRFLCQCDSQSAAILFHKQTVISHFISKFELIYYIKFCIFFSIFAHISCCVTRIQWTALNFLKHWCLYVSILASLCLCVIRTQLSFQCLKNDSNNSSVTTSCVTSRVEDVVSRPYIRVLRVICQQAVAQQITVFWKLLLCEELQIQPTIVGASALRGRKILWNCSNINYCFQFTAQMLVVIFTVVINRIYNL